MATQLIEFLKSKGDTEFTALTQKLFPCAEANKAYTEIIGSTCGNEGVVKLLLGLFYVLALNVLFISLLYLSLLVLAFAQDARIQAFRDEDEEYSDSYDYSSYGDYEDHSMSFSSSYSEYSV